MMRISPKQVLKSNAGYYIGTLCNDPDIGEDNVIFPYERLSGYYPTHEGAQSALDRDDYYRP